MQSSKTEENNRLRFEGGKTEKGISKLVGKTKKMGKLLENFEEGENLNQIFLNQVYIHGLEQF
jgi:hypothetical protein